MTHYHLTPAWVTPHLALELRRVNAPREDETMSDYGARAGSRMTHGALQSLLPPSVLNSLPNVYNLVNESLPMHDGIKRAYEVMSWPHLVITGQNLDANRFRANARQITEWLEAVSLQTRGTSLTAQERTVYVMPGQWRRKKTVTIRPGGPLSPWNPARSALPSVATIIGRTNWERADGWSDETTHPTAHIRNFHHLEV